MAEPQPAGGGQPTGPGPVELLLDAIDAMPEAHRRRVLLWLLESGPRAARPGWSSLAFQRGAVARISELPGAGWESLVSRFTALRGEHQVVPVRLETDRYERLRDWCGQHGFSMATVMRGLLARFLDEQQPARAAAPPADAPTEADPADAGPAEPADPIDPQHPAQAAADAALDAAAAEAAARAEEEGRSR
jgi:hypothetical protein